MAYFLHYYDVIVNLRDVRDLGGERHYRQACRLTMSMSPCPFRPFTRLLFLVY